MLSSLHSVLLRELQLYKSSGALRVHRLARTRSPIFRATASSSHTHQATLNEDYLQEPRRHLAHSCARTSTAQTSAAADTCAPARTLCEESPPSPSPFHACIAAACPTDTPRHHPDIARDTARYSPRCSPMRSHLAEMPPRYPETRPEMGTTMRLSCPPSARLACKSLPTPSDPHVFLGPCICTSVHVSAPMKTWNRGESSPGTGACGSEPCWPEPCGYLVPGTEQDARYRSGAMPSTPSRAMGRVRGAMRRVAAYAATGSATLAATPETSGASASDDG